MRSNAVMRTLTTLGLGLAGLVGGHALGYALAVADDYHRTALLDATGHGYMPSASRLAVMLGIAAVLTGISAGYLYRPRTAHPSFAGVAVRLAVLQCAGFVVLEMVERLIAGAPVSSLSLLVLVVGVLSQVFVGVVGSLLIVGLRRLGAVLRTAEPIAAVGRTETFVTSDVFPFSRTRLHDRVRGPPAVRPA